MICGTGPAYAAKLVRAFGRRCWRWLGNHSARLRKVGGIRPERAARIAAGWAAPTVATC